MMKPIPAQERLIFALDVQTAEEGRALVEQLGDAVCFYKIGLELFMAGGYFEMLDWLAARGKKIFVDLKFFDVPETVKRAVAALKGRPVEFCTVHGNQKIMEAAAEASRESGIKALAVTVLTSLDRGDLADLGFDCDPAELVLSRARRALESGCAGVISSGQEALLLRESLGEKLLIISPGIRPVDNATVDDQKRTMTPRAAALAIQAEIAAVFAGK